MALVGLDGSYWVPIGPNPFLGSTGPSAVGTALDAANEAIIMIGYVVTSDGGSHTIDTTGSSSLAWRCTSATFADGGTVVKVGLAAVDTATGPAARAVNVANVITFDVNASYTGGGGGLTNAMITSVPTAGTKTVANGDLIAFAVQMTARGGVTDSVSVGVPGSIQISQLPTVTTYTGAAYAGSSALPSCFITFADGATGWFYGSEVYSAFTTRTWNTAGAVDAYGQLYQLPFPCKIYGLWGFLDPDADCSVILYSDPLGTPVAERTVSIDANVVGVAQARRFSVLFPTPYTTAPDQIIVAAFLPGASNISVPYKTIGNAAHRISDVWGTRGYGVQTAGGGAAFSNSNSSLDHYYIGLLVGAFEHGVNPTYVAGLGL
jgi:hypothetical protein